MTPVAPPNSTSKTTFQPQTFGQTTNRWWIIDYWNTPQGAFPGYSTSFTAVANTIGNWATQESILILPINIAYGTSNTNCVWFQFSIEFFYDGSVVWDIQNNICPATTLSEYHITDVGIPYVIGDSYLASMSPTSSTQATFSITDTTSTASWSMVFSIPSASVVYDSSTFSPASAVEGVPYRTSPSYTNVPYFPFTVQHGQTATSHLATASSGYNPPTTLNTYHAQSANAGTWIWAMEGTPAVTSTDKTSYYQGDTIHYTGSDFTSNGAVEPCLTTDPTHVTCFLGQPNADSSGNVAGVLSIASNWPTGLQHFWVYDVSGNINSPEIPLPIIAATYAATFAESGMPSGTTWGVTVGGTHHSTSSGTSIQVSGLTGTVSYSYDSPVSVSGGSYSCTASCSGSVSGAGTVTATFLAQITFYTYPSSAGSISWNSCSNPGYTNGQTLLSNNFGTHAICYVPSGYTFSSWSCSYGLTCSGSNDPTTVSFTGPGSVTLNLKIGSLSGPVSTSLTASATLSGSSFTVTGSLTAGGVGLSNEKIVLVFSWSTNIVTVMTTGGSYTYTGTAPTTTGSYNIDAFFLGDYTANSGNTQYLPSKATAMIT